MREIKSGRRQLRLPLPVHASGVEHARVPAGSPEADRRCPTTRGRRSIPRYPLQVTIRAMPGLPSLRSARVFGALRRAITRASVDRFRVIHYAIQQDHEHLNAAAGIDPRSSGPHFSGWHRRPQLESADVASGAADAAAGWSVATAAPATSMATVGWRRAGGLLKVEERPATPLHPRPSSRPPPGPT